MNMTTEQTTQNPFTKEMIEWSEVIALVEGSGFYTMTGRFGNISLDLNWKLGSNQHYLADGTEILGTVTSDSLATAELPDVVFRMLEGVAIDHINKKVNALAEQIAVEEDATS